MLVFEVMTKDPVTVPEGTPVKTALARLAELRVTSLPVVGRDGKVVGVVSEADLIRELLARDPRVHEIPPPRHTERPTVVDEVMTRHPVSVTPDSDLVDAVELLTSTTVKCLPVIDRKGTLHGVVSRSDIVRLLARSDDDIEREVDELLRSTGLEGWLVDVHDGSVELLGPDKSPNAGSDATVVRLLAETVPGVLDVTTRPEGR